MAKILDLETEFPNIRAVSDKQENYASYLRNQYVTHYYHKFKRLEDQYECGLDTIPWKEYEYEELADELTRKEWAILTTSDAGYLISELLNDFDDEEGD